MLLKLLLIWHIIDNGNEVHSIDNHCLELMLRFIDCTLSNYLYQILKGCFIVKSDTRCSCCGCPCQGYKGPDGKIYCADCYKKIFGKWPWDWWFLLNRDNTFFLCLFEVYIFLIWFVKRFKPQQSVARQSLLWLFFYHVFQITMQLDVEVIGHSAESGDVLFDIVHFGYLWRGVSEKPKKAKIADSSLFGSGGVLFRVSGINRSHWLTWGNRGGYSSFMTSIISFIPSLNPAMNISRSDIEDMSVMHSVSFSNSSFCSSERDSLNKSSFLFARAFSFWYSGVAEMLIS